MLRGCVCARFEVERYSGRSYQFGLNPGLTASYAATLSKAASCRGPFDEQCAGIERIARRAGDSLAVGKGECVPILGEGGEDSKSDLVCPGKARLLLVMLGMKRIGRQADDDDGIQAIIDLSRDEALHAGVNAPGGWIGTALTLGSLPTRPRYRPRSVERWGRGRRRRFYLGLRQRYPDSDRAQRDTKTLAIFLIIPDCPFERSASFQNRATRSIGRACSAPRRSLGTSLMAPAVSGAKPALSSSHGCEAHSHPAGAGRKPDRGWRGRGATGVRSQELVENSLDAGAHRVDIAIERGGSARIAVTDDGCGMSREDAILSLRRHATSKIRNASDLAAITTLGFRGEALASIASVSRMTLRARRADDSSGVEIVAIGGDIEESRECGIAPGTQIDVRDLFFNTPARLKFLKTVPTEQGAVAEAVQRLALVNFRIAFTLLADGRTLFDLPRAASSLERVRQVLGPKLAAQMLAFETARDHMRVHGLATMSQESFASPRMIFTFVNGRSVRDKLLTRAVGQAHQTLLPRGRHPAVVLTRPSPRGCRRQRPSNEDRSTLSHFRRGVRDGLSCPAAAALRSDRGTGTGTGGGY